jgi:hypothetical protein
MTLEHRGITIFRGATHIISYIAVVVVVVAVVVDAVAPVGDGLLIVE